MDTNVVGRGTTISDRFRSVVEEKAQKIEQLDAKAQSLEVKVSASNEKGSQSGEERVELTLVHPGPLARAEASSADKFAALDIALDKLLERLRRSKDKAKVHRGLHRPKSLHEVSADGFSGTDVTPAAPEVIEAVATGTVPIVTGDEQEDDYTPVVIRKKVFPSKLMTQTEAVDHMELVGHDFFLFVDAETDRPSVVYRRKGWNYGIISLDDEDARA